MSADIEQWPPPDNPDVFESFCRDLWGDIWQTHAQKNGRRGQPQAGVDVFGQHENKWVGIQCKQKNNLLRRKITRRELDNEVIAARRFKPPLDQFIVATTGPRDANIQECARELSDLNKSKGLFSITVWPWADIWSTFYGRRTLLTQIASIYWPTLASNWSRENTIDRRQAIFMAPDLPANFVRRDSEFGRLKDLLLGGDRETPIAITAALSGAGGFGKTTLAAALCHDEDVISGFPAGILWITLGQEPNLLSAAVTIYSALGPERPNFASEEDAAFQIGRKLDGQRCLFVIDDVWDQIHLFPFMRGGKSCVRLFTTRNVEIASRAQSITVDEMSERESLAFICEGVPRVIQATATKLYRLLGKWPIAMELACAMIRERISQGDSAEQAAKRLLNAIESRGVRILESASAQPRHRTISCVLEASLDLLTQTDRQKLFELSIFPEDVHIPLSSASSVWSLDEFDTERLALRFARLSLLKLDLQNEVASLHDVIRSWLASNLTMVRDLHSRLVYSWTDWYKLPNRYAWRWLIWHLNKADRTDDIQRLLQDPVWIEQKLNASDLNELISDFGYVSDSRERNLLQSALRLSAHVISEDTRQLIPQLMGRLLDQASSYLKSILRRRRAGSMPLLEPITRDLHPPGTPLQRQLTGHSEEVGAVAAYKVGQREMVISASNDKTLVVWDLDKGSESARLVGHLAAVRAVAVDQFGRLAISGDAAGTIKIWDLEANLEAMTWNGHNSSINVVALYQLGNEVRAISGSSDKTLAIWNAVDGSPLLTLRGHSDDINCVAIFDDGARALSGSNDGSLVLWDLITGKVLRRFLIGGQSVRHRGRINAVAIFDDGQKAIIGFNRPILAVLDLGTGRVERRLGGRTRHHAKISSVAVMVDGTRAISASYDETLKIWDLGTGALIRTLKGHDSWITAVAVLADGRRAVSSSYDRSVRIWDLESTSEALEKERAAYVRRVIVQSDTQQAISATLDGLQVWDIKTGAKLRDVSEISGQVHTIASEGGNILVAASFQSSFMVWAPKVATRPRVIDSDVENINVLAVYDNGRRAIVAGDGDF